MHRHLSFCGPTDVQTSTRADRRARGRLCLASTLLGSVCFASFSAVAAVAAAADPGTTSVDTVVVTARKRVEDVQKVPIAITVVQRTVLKDGKLNELSEILNLVPNVSFKNDQFTSSDISIRGSSRNLNAEEPGVGIVRDGVYIGGLLTNTSTLYDLDRVEVLGVPQAGLYEGATPSAAR